MEDNLKLMKTMRMCGHILYHNFSLIESRKRIIFTLYKFGPMSQNELMKYINIKSGSLSELITKVEKCGFVIKQTSSEDKRKKVLTLTPLGVTEAKKYEDNREKNADLLFASLTKEEKEILQKILDKSLISWKELLEKMKEENKNV